MKVRIEVASREEGELIEKAMSDPATKAFAIISATLQSLPSDRARRRVMAFVKDYFEEQDGQKMAIMQQELREAACNVE